MEALVEPPSVTHPMQAARAVDAVDDAGGGGSRPRRNGRIEMGGLAQQRPTAHPHSLGDTVTNPRAGDLARELHGAEVFPGVEAGNRRNG